MRTWLMALCVFGGPAACERRADREAGAADADRDRSGIDTIVRTEKVKDTTIVRADTSIDVDTVKQTEHDKEAD